jgi:type IV pilus assembly protein PilE
MQRGFTLIEMLIALAIAAILASWAVPSYSAHLARAHRLEGVLALQQLMLQQEQKRSNNAAYAESIDELRAPRSTRYRFSVQDADARGYTVAATAIGPQAHDRACAVLLLTVRGGDVQYQHEGSAAPGRCWGR